MTGHACVAFVSWLAAASVVGAASAIIDKGAARRGRRRVPERVLHGAALLGGGLATAVALAMLHHKTRKPRFLGPFAAATLAGLAVAALVWRGLEC